MTPITSLLGTERCLSIELWPPRNESSAARLETALVELEELHPSFVAVTYGAGGSTRERTHELVVRLARRGRSAPMAHLVCAAHTRAELVERLEAYEAAGIENVLALRGDPPLSGDSPLEPGQLSYAVELVRLAKEVGGFCVGVAAHPEGHPDSLDRATDLAFQAAKLREADFAITQFFFRAADYFALVEEMAARGADRPIVPGVMPITNARTVTKMAEMSGSAVPEALAARIEAVADEPDEVYKIGVEVATELCEQLLNAGVPGLHFYTMNQSRATREVCANLGIGAATG